MRYTITPEREAEFLDAVFGVPGAPSAPLNHQVAQEVAWVREVFVHRMGWSRLQVSRYPVRALGAIARTGDWSLCRLKGPGDYVPELPESLLTLTLNELAALPQSQRRAHADAVTLPATREVLEVGASPKPRYRIGDEARGYVARLCKAHGVPPMDGSDADWTRAALSLLRLAFKEE